MNRFSAVSQSRATTAGLWVFSLLITLVLVGVRFQAAMGSLWYDFQSYFLPAARRMAAGGSPYEVKGYVYSPLLASLLAFAADWEPWERAAILWTAMSLGCCVVIVVLGTMSLRVPGKPLLTPVLLAIISVTLLYNWPTTLVLWLGQTDLMLLAAVSVAGLGAARGRPAVTGIGLALGALIKTWPALIVLWLLRRAAKDSGRTLAWFVGIGVAALASTAVLLGPDQLSAWLQAVTRASDQPEVLHFSAFGFGHQLFGPTIAGNVASVVFALVVFGALLVTLWRPGDPWLSLWHVSLAVVLLIPISHAVYLLLGLPIIWHWSARAVSGHVSRRTFPPLIVSWVWWVITFRTMWPGDMTTRMDPGAYAAVILSTLGVLTTSVACEALMPQTIPRTGSGENEKNS